MEPVLPALSRAEILLYPAIPQLKVAAEWLFQHPEPNLDLEIALNRVLAGQSAPADSGGFWAIAHTSPNPLTLTPQQVCGVVMASPNKGFAKRLLAFSVSQMLQDYPAVKLWVDDDNHGAIALYRSLGFRPVGALYIGYFQP